MNKYHFSTSECFENCPKRFEYRYIQDLDVIESDDPQNPLKLGTAIHRSMETDIETGVSEYLSSYPICDDRHIAEVIKIDHWIKIMKKLIPEGLHETPFENSFYKGTADLLVPIEDGVFDLYDYKYSNNIDHYMNSRQLHVYKYFLEKIRGIQIRKMFFVFVPKVMIKQKQTETVEMFRNRLINELDQREIQIKEVEFDHTKVDEFFEICLQIATSTEFPKNETRLCDFCEYKDICQKGQNYMILPSAERRTVGETTKRKLWIYGSAFSGKTTFADKAPAPLNLNTDGNIQFVTMPYMAIKDTFEGRQKVSAWDVFKRTIDELEKTAGQNGFKTIVVDLLEDTYESCRLYMYDKLGITHESDDSFRAWDKVRTEFLSTIRRLINLDYENVILISHEDMSKDITRKSGDKITSVKPNIADKVATKVAGMVDIVARVVVDGDTRTLEFKSDEVVFGGGRLKVGTTSVPLDWDALCQVYDEANGHISRQNATKTEETKKVEEVNVKTEEAVQTTPEHVTEDLPFDEDPKPAEPKPAEPKPAPAENEAPVRARRTRRTRN